MERNIENEHFEKIEEMIEGYTNIRNEMDECHSKIKKVKTRAIDLSESLNKMRSEELEFFSNLEKIYGPGKFDPIKNKWILSEDKGKNK